MIQTILIDVLLGLARHGAGALGLHEGITEAELANKLTGWATFVAMIAWSAWRKYNRAKQEQSASTVKAPSILLAFGLCFGLCVGCAGPGAGNGWTVERFAVLAKSVTTEAAIIHLEEKPQHRKTIELVVEQLNICIVSGLYTPARLRAILKPLGIRELASKEGRIFVAGTIVIYDMVIGSTDTTADPTKLKPVFEGIRDGFQTALDTIK